MSMMIGTIGFTNNLVRRIEIKNADGTTAGSITVSKPQKKKQKRLQYNFKQISSQIMKAKTSGNARQAVSSARQKAAFLRRQAKSGEYDDRELQSAILHADAMVRVAKKRMKHLQQEENAKVKDDEYGFEEAPLLEDAEEYIEDEQQAEVLEGLDANAMRELLEEYQKIMQDMVEEAGEAAGGTMEELSEELTVGADKEFSPSDFETLKKKHRSEELRDIMEADMKYLKAMFDKLEKEKREAGSSSGSNIESNTESVALELGGVEVPVQAAELPVAAEGGMIDATV